MNKLNYTPQLTLSLKIVAEMFSDLEEYDKFLEDYVKTKKRLALEKEQQLVEDLKTKCSNCDKHYLTLVLNPLATPQTKILPDGTSYKYYTNDYKNYVCASCATKGYEQKGTACMLCHKCKTPTVKKDDTEYCPSCQKVQYPASHGHDTRLEDFSYCWIVL